MRLRVVVVLFSLLLLVGAARGGAGLEIPGVPEGAQVLVRAGEFPRTNLRVDREHWGDALPVLRNNEEYPNFASATSRWPRPDSMRSTPSMPPSSRARWIYLDGRLVVRDGLAGNG